MKAHYRKRKTHYAFELTGQGRATAHGGQILVDALCRRFHLISLLKKSCGSAVRDCAGGPGAATAALPKGVWGQATSQQREARKE